MNVHDQQISKNVLLIIHMHINLFFKDLLKCKCHLIQNYHKFVFKTFEMLFHILDQNMDITNYLFRRLFIFHHFCDMLLEFNLYLIISLGFLTKKKPKTMFNTSGGSICKKKKKINDMNFIATLTTWKTFFIDYLKISNGTEANFFEVRHKCLLISLVDWEQFLQSSEVK